MEERFLKQWNKIRNILGDRQTAYGNTFALGKRAFDRNADLLIAKAYRLEEQVFGMRGKDVKQITNSVIDMAGYCTLLLTLIEEGKIGEAKGTRGERTDISAAPDGTV